MVALAFAAQLAADEISAVVKAVEQPTARVIFVEQLYAAIDIPLLDTAGEALRLSSSLEVVVVPGELRAPACYRTP